MERRTRICFVLHRAEDTVAGDAETGDDVAVLVELLIEAAAVELNVGMRVHQALDADGGGDDGHELDVLAAALLDEVDRGAGASARREHRIEQDDEALVDVLGQLAVIFMGLKSLVIAIKADMSDLRGGHERVDAVDHSQTGAEDGDDGELLAGDDGGDGLGNGRLDLDLRRLQIPGDLIAISSTSSRNCLFPVLTSRRRVILCEISGWLKIVGFS